MLLNLIKKTVEEKKYLTPYDFLKQNGKVNKKGKVSFPVFTKQYFSLIYCKIQWDKVDKIKLEKTMSTIYHNGYSGEPTKTPLKVNIF